MLVSVGGRAWTRYAQREWVCVACCVIDFAGELG
jgi:hypothetical protein